MLPGVTVHIPQVDYYASQEVRERYERKRDELRVAHGEVEEIWGFHGNPQDEQTRSIMCEGFKVGVTVREGQAVAEGEVHMANADVHGRGHGRGVYAATGPATPWAYMRGNRKVILAQALRGRAVGYHERDGGDSWQPRAAMSEDWVVFRDRAQLLPRYVVHCG